MNELPLGKRRGEERTGHTYADNSIKQNKRQRNTRTNTRTFLDDHTRQWQPGHRDVSRQPVLRRKAQKRVAGNMQAICRESSTSWTIEMQQWGHGEKDRKKTETCKSKDGGAKEEKNHKKRREETSRRKRALSLQGPLNPCSLLQFLEQGTSCADISRLEEETMQALWCCSACTHTISYPCRGNMHVDDGG